ncbi:hypothetical protein [Cryobacterium ruanii]|nr:hypothetical protein [Cryobacterium ruanii]
MATRWARFARGWLTAVVAVLVAPLSPRQTPTEGCTWPSTRRARKPWVRT